MAGTIWLKRLRYAGSDIGLWPYDKEGTADVLELPLSKPLRADIWQPRNNDLTRLYWAIVSRLARGMGRDKEDIDRELRVLAGHCDTYLTEKYGQIRVPKSIKEKDCDEMAFKAYFDACIPLIYSEFDIDHKAIDDLLKPKDRNG